MEKKLLLPVAYRLLLLQRQLRETQEAQRDNLSVVLVRRVVEDQYQSSFCRNEEGEGRLAARTPRSSYELIGRRDLERIVFGAGEDAKRRPRRVGNDGPAHRAGEAPLDGAHRPSSDLIAAGSSTGSSGSSSSRCASRPALSA